MKKVTRKKTPLEKFFKETFDDRILLFQIMKMKPKELEAIYSIVYTLFHEEKFEEAEKIIKILCLLDHVNPKYWKTLAKIYRAQNKYIKAEDAFAMGVLINNQDLENYILGAECIYMQKRKDDALFVLSKALVIAQKNKNKRMKELIQDQIKLYQEIK